MGNFFAPESTPFAVALFVVALIALVEIVGLFLGFSASHAIDSQIPDIHAEPDTGGHLSPFIADAHGHGLPETQAGPLSQVLGWLSVGRVPILVLLIVFLCTFGLVGFLIQALAGTFAGGPLPAVLVSIPAFVAAVPAVRYAGLGLARVMPKEETDAVSQKTFLGKVAVVTQGEARRGLPAEAKFRDHRGQTHYLLVEPDEDDAKFARGAEVLIVQQSGSVYRVIANTNAAMSDRQP
jgi:hypothetical protein